MDGLIDKVWDILHDIDKITSSINNGDPLLIIILLSKLKEIEITKEDLTVVENIGFRFEKTNTSIKIQAIDRNEALKQMYKNMPGG